MNDAELKEAVIDIEEGNEMRCQRGTSVLLELARDYIQISGNLPKEKEEWETCTKCGGLGRVPNHPHILAHTCDKCNGNKKIHRIDYKFMNEYRQSCILAYAKREQELKEGLPTEKEIQDIIQSVIDIHFLKDSKMDGWVNFVGNPKNFKQDLAIAIRSRLTQNNLLEKE